MLTRTVVVSTLAAMILLGACTDTQPDPSRTESQAGEPDTGGSPSHEASPGSSPEAAPAASEPEPQPFGAAGSLPEAGDVAFISVTEEGTDLVVIEDGRIVEQSSIMPFRRADTDSLVGLGGIMDVLWRGAGHDVLWTTCCEPASGTIQSGHDPEAIAFGARVDGGPGGDLAIIDGPGHLRFGIGGEVVTSVSDAIDVTWMSASVAAIIAGSPGGSQALLTVDRSGDVLTRVSLPRTYCSIGQWGSHVVLLPGSPYSPEGMDCESTELEVYDPMTGELGAPPGLATAIVGISTSSDGQHLVAWTSSGDLHVHSVDGRSTSITGLGVVAADL